MFLIVKKFGIQNTSFNSLKTEEIFNRLRSEDSPHKSGIKTTNITVNINCFLSEDSPHKSGIKTDMGGTVKPTGTVGRLAPQIGD